MSKHNYKLINPIIEGTIETVYEAESPLKGAEKFWIQFAKNILDHVPKFVFSMKDETTDYVNHFVVVEDPKTKSFTISNLELDIEPKEFNDLEEKVEKYNENNQKGGRKRYDSSDSSDMSSSVDSITTESLSSSEPYDELIYPALKRTSPIAMLHYKPYIYSVPLQPKKPSTMNPKIVGVISKVVTPIIPPRFNPIYGTQIALW